MFSRAGHSLNNKRADIFVTDNPVLFPLDGGNDIFILSSALELNSFCRMSSWTVRALSIINSILPPRILYWRFREISPLISPDGDR